jgi:hypothetical protein
MTTGQAGDADTEADLERARRAQLRQDVDQEIHLAP